MGGGGTEETRPTEPKEAPTPKEKQRDPLASLGFTRTDATEDKG